MLGFCSSARFIDHDTGPHHPERPDRIRAIHKAVRDAGLVRSPNPFPDFHLDLGLPSLKNMTPLIEIEPISAEERWLHAVHPAEHIEHVRNACAAGEVLDQGDTPVEPHSFATALLSAGAGLTCCDAVMSGRVKRAFAAIRPPGHHAEPDRAMGFCLLSNLAIAARYIQKKHGVDRVAIVDFDVHHGNGTQAVFYADPTVLFISLHQHPATCYPGTGYEEEIGTGAGRGYTLNIPMQPGGDDAEYSEAVAQQVIPKLEKFRPQMLLLSAGFDAHEDDPLAQMRMSEDGFDAITRMLVAAADHHCGGRIVSLLEGGYNLRALGRSVVRHLIAMQDGT
jgi:acetoin utilization deacetylase AcuC-like enzyme